MTLEQAPKIIEMVFISIISFTKCVKSYSSFPAYFMIEIKSFTCYCTVWPWKSAQLVSLIWGDLQFSLSVNAKSKMRGLLLYVNVVSEQGKPFLLSAQTLLIPTCLLQSKSLLTTKWKNSSIAQVFSDNWKKIVKHIFLICVLYLWQTLISALHICD